MREGPQPNSVSVKKEILLRVLIVKYRVISQDNFLISGFFQNLPLPPKKKRSHQGKKEVACIVSKPLVSWDVETL